MNAMETRPCGHHIHAFPIIVLDPPPHSHTQYRIQASCATFTLSCRIHTVMSHSHCHVAFTLSCHIHTVMSHSHCHVTFTLSCHIHTVMSHSHCHVTFKHHVSHSHCHDSIYRCQVSSITRLIRSTQPHQLSLFKNQYHFASSSSP